jgi:hypothetical protein
LLITEGDTEMTKGKVVFISIVLVVLTMSFGCVSTTPRSASVKPISSFDPANWQTECGALVQALTDLVPKSVREQNGTSNEQFIGKEVAWELNFIAAEKGKDGKESLRFDLEPSGIKYQFFSGKPVLMSFSPAANTWDSWNTIKQNSRVRITGRIANIMFATVNPKDNSSNKSPIAISLIENVKLDYTPKENPKNNVVAMPTTENVKLGASIVSDDPATKPDNTLRKITQREDTRECIENNKDAKATQEFIRTFPLEKGPNLKEQIAQNPRVKEVKDKMVELAFSDTSKKMSRLEVMVRVETMLRNEGFLSADNPEHYAIGLKWAAFNAYAFGLDGVVSNWSRKNEVIARTGSFNGLPLVVNQLDKTFSMDGLSVSWAAMEKELSKGGNRVAFDLTKQGFVAHYWLKDCGQLEENITENVKNKILELHR